MSIELATGNEPLVSAREALLADLKRVASDADEMLGELSTTTVEEFASVRNRLDDKLGEARSRLDSARVLATRKVRATADATNEYIRANPRKLLGLASLVGLLAALLLIRRAAR